MMMNNVTIEAGDGGFSDGYPTSHVNKRWHLELGSRKMGVAQFLGSPEFDAPVKQRVIDQLGRQGEDRNQLHEMVQSST